MPRPATRLLALLELLQTRGATAGGELARELGVDRRTLRRYIVQLEELGVPVATERGRHGSYALTPGYRLPPLLFTNDEAVAVALGLVLADKLGVAGDRLAVASAQRKLQRVLPAGARRQGEAIRASVAIDLGGMTGVEHGHLAALSEAALAERTVALRYRSRAAAVTVRRFDPYGLCYRGAGWYLAGYCHLRRGLRTLRIDRIEQVVASDAAFHRPAGFDIAGYVSRSLATLPRAIEVQVLMHAGLEQVRSEIFSMLGTLAEVPGGVLLTGSTDDLDWFARRLVPLSFPFTPLAPAGLGAALVRVAEQLIARLGPAGNWGQPGC